VSEREDGGDGVQEVSRCACCGLSMQGGCLCHWVEKAKALTAERDEARAAAKHFCEGALNEVVGRSCYAEALKEIFAQYPWLEEMGLDP
jgi:hypothetical protein